MPNAGTHPDYFGGVTPNWANTPLIRKFVDGLPGLGSANANGLVTPGGDPAGQYLSVAVPDKLTYPGCDYYEIELRQFREKMHSDLPPTLLQGYVQVNNGTNAAGTLNDVAPAPIHYLGPVIVAEKDRPVRIKYTNKLPTGTAGDLFIPTDTTVMGAGMGPYMAMPMMADQVGGAGSTVMITTMDPHNLQAGERIMLEGFEPAAYDGMFMVLPTGLDATHFQVTLKSDPGGPATTMGHVMEHYTQNRATLHLHGGLTAWTSDGTPHQWTVPAGEITQYPKGASTEPVPDMPAPGDGSMTFYYNNQQSARLMFYHDHAYGITRLNVYVGEVSAYLIMDQVEKDLIEGTNVSGVNPGGLHLLPDVGIPLIIQDKTFVDAGTLPTTNPTWNAGSSPGNAITGELWYPDVYMPNENPNADDGINAMGRWDYGPWFWPPWPAVVGPVTNGTNPDGSPHVEPGYPDLSMTMETMFDTPLINGTAYPTLTVDPKTYRFRILNGANDRFWNLSLFQASGLSIAVTNGGSGYSMDTTVTLDAPPAGGVQATAQPVIVAGVVSNIWVTNPGSGYTTVPNVTIHDPTGPGAGATAVAGIGLDDVKMVPAVQGAAAFPESWTAQAPGSPGNILDGRPGGVPDPALIGPTMIQIGTEGGFLPNPVVWPNMPCGHDNDVRSVTVGNIKEHNLFLGCAERADVLIDFSQFAGKTLIVYNDSPAPAPALDARLDYFTGHPDYRDIGGDSTTYPGYGPNTRTIMQIKVAETRSDGQPIAPYDLAALQAAFTATATKPSVFAAAQDPIIVPQAGYDSAYNGTFPTGMTAYEQIASTSLSFKPLDLSTPALGDVVSTPITITNNPKAIAEEFENWYGRMQGYLGVEMQFTNGQNQTTVWFDFMDPATEIVDDCVATPLTPVDPCDGTQIWKITHNGVDTHPIHFHLFNVQLINRVDWVNGVKPPEDNELGWKETVRMNPLEDCIVAMRVKAPTQPFGIPDSIRRLDPTMPPDWGDPATGGGLGFKQVNPDGTPIVPALLNEIRNFGWEYMWHCHILSHEEMDMMRPIIFNVARSLPDAPVLEVTGPSVASLIWTDGTPFNYATGTPATTMGNPAGEVGFRIERSVNGGPFETLASAPANTTAYTDDTITPFTLYEYRVVAYNAAGDSPSNTVMLGGEVIMDNLDPGVSAVGTWSPSSTSGFWATDSVYSNTGGSTFTFSGTPVPGMAYAIYGWWTAASNRSMTVPFQIRNDATLLDTFTVNQRVNGGQWNLLGVYTFTGVASVTVVQSGGITVADAVRFLPVTLQSIGITGPATVNEGSVAGYSAIAQYSGGIFAPAQPQVWAVDTAATIDATGQLTAALVDADTPAVVSAEYTVHGTTASATYDVTVLNTGPVEVIIDNLDPGTSQVGTWNLTTTPGFYATNSAYNTTVGNSFTFTTTLAPGTYTVYGWWTAATNRYRQVPYQIRDGATLLGTAIVNQRLDGGQWNLLGTYTFTGPASVTVVTAGSVTIADAVRFVPVTGPVEMIVDNLSPGTSSTGTWTPSANPGFWATNAVYSNTAGSMFNFPVTLIPGTYNVYAWWTAATNRSTAVPYEIRDGVNLLGTVPVNQRVNGSQWNLLGSFTFTGPASVTVIRPAGGVTIADAVRFVPIP